MTACVQLREVAVDDLPIFFEQQLDPGANYMAAFTAEDPTDRAAFDRHWQRIRTDSTITIRTILAGDEVAGSVTCYIDEDGRPEVSYWLGRAYWGQGIATAALSELLDELTERPLSARAAADNVGSVRVLEKCGFRIIAEERGYANARGTEIDEYLLRLD